VRANSAADRPVADSVIAWSVAGVAKRVTEDNWSQEIRLEEKADLAAGSDSAQAATRTISAAVALLIESRAVSQETIEVAPSSRHNSRRS
jgi:hypothetical protein